MPDIKPEHLLLIVGFVLPGAISMFVYGLKVPQMEFALKDRIIEAICFSLVNYVLVWGPARLYVAPSILQATSFAAWLVQVIEFLVAPVFWPFLLLGILHKAERRGWIGVRAKTAWDYLFDRQSDVGCWIQVELNDGRTVGGVYGTRSFASSWPDPGHLYLEELWTVDPFGVFGHKVVGEPGILLRPGDYKLLRVFAGGR